MKKIGAVMWLCVLATIGGIAYLTRQPAEQSYNLTLSAEENLPLAVVNPLKEQGFKVNTRQMAHVYEFFVLGIFLTLALRFTKYINAFYLFLTSSAICLELSLFDQIHKMFVPGRHFDYKDMFFDALGYLTAIFIVLAGECVRVLWKGRIINDRRTVE